MDRTAERTLLQQAARQHGVITGAQARAAGLSRGQISRQVEAGRWRRLTRDVFVVQGTSPPPHQLAMAAHLSRPGSSVALLTALRVLGVDVAAPPMPHLIVPPGTSGRSPLAVVHRIDLPSSHTTRRAGMQVTEGARTLVDLVRVMPPNRFRSVVDTAMHQRIATAPRVDQVAAEAGLGRAARARLDACLRVWRHTIRPGSAAEARLLRCLHQWGVPEPERQVAIRDEDGTVIARLDGGWPGARVGFEYDSIEWHGPARWEGDEARHRRVTRLGWQVVHIEAHDLRPGEHLVRDVLRAVVPTPSLARR